MSEKIGIVQRSPLGNIPEGPRSRERALLAEQNRSRKPGDGYSLSIPVAVMTLCPLRALGTVEGVEILR